jgi:hypothetical protein
MAFYSLRLRFLLFSLTTQTSCNIKDPVSSAIFIMINNKPRGRANFKGKAEREMERDGEKEKSFEEISGGLLGC